MHIHTTVQSTDDFAINEDMYIHRAAEPRELHFFNWNSFFVVLSNLGYSMFPIKRTVFLCTATVLKNTVRLIGNIE